MIITGCVVNDNSSYGANIHVANGRITAITETGTMDGPLIFPGFVDIHNHGGAGESFPNSDLDGCRKAARHHARHGTTAMLASLVSAPKEVLLRQTAILAQLAEEGEIVGVHLEGPFVNTCRCGAQDPAAIIPGDRRMFAEIAAAGRGYLKSVTFAPETTDAKGLVDVCADYGIIASLGHTDADVDTTWGIIEYALNKGVKVTATHLFNAMPPIHHRNPGAAVALLDAAIQGLIHLELVADGVHLNDAIVSMVRHAAPTQAVFITDAMAAAGMADGQYQLGALDVTVAGGVAHLTQGGAIAGGTSVLAQQLARHYGNNLCAMVPLLSSNAAKVLDIEAGHISVGRPADLVVLDQDFQVLETYRQGELVTAL